MSRDRDREAPSTAKPRKTTDQQKTMEQQKARKGRLRRRPGTRARRARRAEPCVSRCRGHTTPVPATTAPYRAAGLFRNRDPSGTQDTS
ncbi:hypothetical protein STXM2123_5384 [Streptomyces sp. F-3]|nr:hypothetical protein STXM2123_5384 [Streptomyces sp. F-3]